VANDGGATPGCTRCSALPGEIAESLLGLVWVAELNPLDDLVQGLLVELVLLLRGPVGR
jgi:hypothetical protein